MTMRMSSLSRSTRALLGGGVIVGAIVGAVAVAGFVLLPASASQTAVLPAELHRAVVLPAPLVDLAATESGYAVAVLGGGCFWGVQGVFQHVEGVVSAVSGYAGGTEEAANYAAVVAGGSDHAEVVEITYDPTIVSYGALLHIFFSVVHDPTQLDQQWPDFGAQYRSVIFAGDEEEAEVAALYIAQLDEAGVFEAPIVTRVEQGHPFYRAEDRHQDFVVRNPVSSYVVNIDLPKIDDLERVFPDRFRAEPVLVLGD